MSLVDFLSVALDFVSDFTEVYSPFNIHNVSIYCRGFILLKGICMKTSSLLILAMSFERFCSLFFPIFYKERVNFRVLVNTLIVSVTYGVISSSISALTQGNENGHCFEPLSGINPMIILVNVAESLLLHLVIPSILTLVINFSIALKLKQRAANKR